MGVNTTIKSGLIVPQVMAAMVSAKLPKMIKFSPLAAVGTSLVGAPGDTVTMPVYNFIGEAADVAEGTPIPISALTATSTQVTIKKAGKGVEITDEAKLSAYGDPIGETENQLAKSIALKVDTDCITALNGIGAGMTSGDGTVPLTADTIADALVLFSEEVDEASVVFISPAQLASIRKDDDFVTLKHMINEPVLSTGTVGEIHGCQVVVTKSLPVDVTDPLNPIISNFIVRAGALGIEMKRDVLVEVDRDIINKMDVITADEHYVAYLKDASKAIKIKSKG